MKLPDLTAFEPLNELRRLMGAELGEFVPAKNSPTLTADEIDRLARSGIEIPLDQVRVLPDGTLAYKNARVVLYIRDVNQYRRHAIGDDNLPRYHISDCTKLQEMRANNRFDRYVVATREDGLFELNIRAADSSRYRGQTHRLRVCQFCLGKIHWDGFEYKIPTVHKRKIVGEFTLSRFFERYKKTLVVFTPAYDASTAPLNEYTADFKFVADRIKQERGHRCDECSINLSNSPRYLHAHHRNGIRSDNRDSNIGILCIGCHAKQPGHAHMKALPEYQEFVRQFRHA